MNDYGAPCTYCQGLIMLRLYDSRFSGNSWKISILLNQLELPFERRTFDLDASKTKTPAFWELSRFAHVPSQF